MVPRNFIVILTLVLVFAVASCSDHRPEAADARVEFSRLYPTTEVVSIRMSEDEIAARSFAITYRHAENSQTKTFELQYMKNDHGVYELRPAPPRELP
jgi:hypothetical protein